MPGKQILLPGQSKLQLAKSRIDAFNDYFYVWGVPGDITRDRG